MRMRYVATMLIVLLALVILPATALAQTVDIRNWPTDPVGRNADAAVTAGAAGTVSGKLRQISADISAMKASLDLLDNIVTSNRAQVDVISVPADPFGLNADAAATAGGPGSIQAKIRRLSADLDGVLAAVQVLGGVNDATVAAGAVGTQSAKLRRLTTDIDTIRTQLAGTLTMACTNCSAGAGGASQSDRTTFTDGSGGINPAAGYYSTAPTDPSSGQAAAVAITQKRAWKVTLYDSAGIEQSVGGGTQYDRDTVAGAADKLTLAGGVRRDTLTSLVNADGDRTTFAFSSIGRLYVEPSLPSGASTVTEQQNQTTVLGGVADAVVAAGATGSISAKLRRVTTDLEAIRALLAAPSAVTGPLTDAQLRATPVVVNASGSTVPVSIASLPNPTGAPTLSSIQDVEAAIRESQGIGGSSPFLVKGAGAVVAQSVAVRCVNLGNTAFESCAGTGGGGGSGVITDIQTPGLVSVMRTTAGSEGINVWNLRALDAANDHVKVQGEAASGATKSGNPVLQGGVFNTTQPTVTTGQAVDLQATARGARIVATGVDLFTVDTELPAAAALNDGLSNPTTPIVGAAKLLWNGGTWDRAKSAANALNSTGTGILATQIVGQFDDTSPTAITENQFGNLRMSANRNLYNTIRDAAGNERGANVDATNRLSVSVDNTVIVSQVPATSGGGSTCYLSSAATTNATNCKASAGQVYHISAINTTATLYYLRTYNLASAPTCSSATGFIETLPIPASTTGSGFQRGMVSGQAYSTGIGFCLTGGGSSTDNTSAATGVYLSVIYK